MKIAIHQSTKQGVEAERQVEYCCTGFQDKHKTHNILRSFHCYDRHASFVTVDTLPAAGMWSRWTMWHVNLVWMTLVSWRVVKYVMKVLGKRERETQPERNERYVKQEGPHGSPGGPGPRTRIPAIMQTRNSCLVGNMIWCDRTDWLPITGVKGANVTSAHLILNTQTPSVKNNGGTQLIRWRE